MRAITHVLALFALVATATAVSAQTVIPVEQPMVGIDSVTVETRAGKGRYLFDSGLGVSAVSPTTAAAIGCTPWGKITGFRATGERIDLQRCNDIDVVIAGTRRRLSEMSVIDLTRFIGKDGERFAGGIGLDAFDGELVTLSVAAHRITVENARRWKQPSNAIGVPIRLVRDSQGAALTADIGITTSAGMVWLEIDTGNYGPSRIDRRAAALVGLDAAIKGRQPLALKAGRNVTLADDVVIGDLIMDGIISRGVLRSWDVTLDLKNGRGWLRAAAAAAAAATGD